MIQIIDGDRTLTVADTAVLIALIATLPPMQQGTIWQQALRVQEQLDVAQAQAAEGETAMPKVSLMRVVAPSPFDRGGTTR